MEIKDPVKAGQLEGLTDWGLKGRQGNISTVATGKLVVADQHCQTGAVHKTHLAQVNNHFLGPSTGCCSSHPSLLRPLLL
jgi:hypothetical protein